MKPIGQNQRTGTIGSKIKVNKAIKGNRTKSRQSKAKIAGQNPKISENKNFIQLLEGTEAPSCRKPPLLPQNDMGTSYFKVGTQTSTPQQGTPPNPVARLVLQLFPMDDVTRKVLEKDKHNPHVELILGVTKKITSVIKHLITKWDTSSVPVGELMLFPFEAQLQNVDGFERWTVENTGLCAGDIYKMLGSPTIFRLRYGWFPNINQSSKKESQNIDTGEEQQLAAGGAFLKPASNNSPSIDRALEEPADLKKNENSDILFANEMTNISPSEILAGAPTINMDANQNRQVHIEGSSRLPFSCDSFDAAIALYKARSTQISNVSILDADETCHAFSLQKNFGLSKDSLTPKKSEHPNLEPFPGKGSGFDAPLSKRHPDLVNPGPFSQECHHDLSETEPHDAAEGEEYKTEIQVGEQGGSRHGLQPLAEGLIMANENGLGLSCINWDSLGTMEFVGMSLPNSIGDESIDFNGLLGIGNSRDASTSCSLVLKT